MNVIIIGTGNIAQVIGKRLSDAGHRIVQVYGRNAAAAKSLSGDLGASFCDEWKNIARELIFIFWPFLIVPYTN
jgi:3-hydroxyisobutyrate dehydrogenase-like beta-hydroxyacid dehydrogenase